MEQNEQQLLAAARAGDAPKFRRLLRERDRMSARRAVERVTVRPSRATEAKVEAVCAEARQRARAAVEARRE